MTISRTPKHRLPTFSPRQLTAIRADAATKAGAIDPDCPPMTADELAGPSTIGRPRRTLAGTKPITARLDLDLIAWLKSQGRGYQTRLNTIVREAMERDRAGVH